MPLNAQEQYSLHNELLEAIHGSAGGGEAVVQPPWILPPANWVSFDPAAYVAIPAVGNQAIIVDFRPPDGMHGIIQRIANVYVGGGFQEGQGNINWQILLEGAPFRGYDNIVASMGSVAQPSVISGIPIKEGQRVQLVTNNIAIVVAGQLVGGRLSGYFYPRDIEPEGTWL
jgi:hypothetical protein